VPGTDPLIAAIYARVSSEQQAKEQTIASQVEALRQRVQQDGLTLPEELCFLDEGCSGSTLLRPALERLRDQAAAGSIDRLYVHSPDRLARKYAYQVLLLDELKRCGVEVVFLNREIGRSPEEDLLLQVQGMVAEYERAKILERSRRGKLHAARRGSLNVLGGAPYGYRYLSRRDNGGEAAYQVVEEEAAVVRQIFRWVGQERCSIGEVCRRLRQAGIPSPTGKECWDRSVVWGLLKNPAYQGTAAFGKTRFGERRPRLRPLRGRPEHSRRSYSVYRTPVEEQVTIAVPALVEAELFAAVAEQLAENKKRQRQSARGARYLLQGLVVCPQCGHAFYGKPVSRSSAKGKTRYTYYRCIGTDAYRFGGERLCQNRQVRTDLLEAAVWDDVRALLADPSRIQQEYERRRSGPARDGRPAEQLQAQVAKAKRGVARLIDAYEDGLVERGEFEPRIRRAKERLEKLEAEVAALAVGEAEEQQVQAVLDQMQEFAQRVSEGLEEASWATRREIIRALVKRVEIDAEEVRVVYKVPPHPFVDGPERGRLQDRLGGEDPALRRPCLRGGPYPVLEDAGLEPLADQTEQYPVTYPSLKELTQVGLLQRVEELADVHLHQPAATQVHRLLPPGLQRLVRRPPGTEAVRAVHKVLLGDRLQHHDDRPLQDLVLQRRYPQRAELVARPFGDVDPPHRRRPLRPRLGAAPKALQVLQQLESVRRGGLAVHAGGRILARSVESLYQPGAVEVVVERGEPLLRSLLRQLRYPLLFR
jgi:site-specific DNA recombinase